MTTKQENKGKIKNTEIELYVINKVKEYRIAAKMSQRKLCMELRLSPTYVFYAESPKYTVKYNLNQLNNLISQVSNTGNVLKGISENQQQTVDSTLAAREQIVGVSADEEMSNMIMFQNAFNASSRYINVVSEMLEHILTTLGR